MTRPALPASTVAHLQALYASNDRARATAGFALVERNALLADWYRRGVPVASLAKAARLPYETVRSATHGDVGATISEDGSSQRVFRLTQKRAAHLHAVTKRYTAARDTRRLASLELATALQAARNAGHTGREIAEALGTSYKQVYDRIRSGSAAAHLVPGKGDEDSHRAAADTLAQAAAVALASGISPGIAARLLAVSAGKVRNDAAVYAEAHGVPTPMPREDAEALMTTARVAWLTARVTRRRIQNRPKTRRAAKGLDG